MNKTITVNIAGFQFNIEERAYDILKSYIDAIRKQLSHEEDASEIIEDIEARIAEILSEKLTEGKDVITLSDIDAVIKTMGEPEEFSDHEYVETHEQETEETYSERKLYRDLDNATIGGVCSGLGAYFDVDALIFKIIFLFLFIVGGSGFLLYIILWILIPEAKTTAQKLQMKGEHINIESIKKQANEIRNQIVDKAKKQKVKHKINNAVNRGLYKSKNAISTLAKVVGIFFVVMGIFGILFLVSLFFGEVGLIPLWGERATSNLGETMDILYQTSFQSSISYYALLIALFIPVTAILFAGVKLFFGIKKKIKVASFIFATIWFTSLGILAITGIRLGLEFKSGADTTQTISSSNQELIIEVDEDKKFSNNYTVRGYEYISLGDNYQIENETVFIANPQITFNSSPSADTTLTIAVIRSSQGLNRNVALEHAKSITYEIKETNNKIILPPFFAFPKDDKYRGQHVEVFVNIPKNIKVILGKNIDRLSPIINEHCIDCGERKTLADKVISNKNGELEVK